MIYIQDKPKQIYNQVKSWILKTYLTYLVHEK